jgi:DNA repair protein RadB
MEKLDPTSLQPKLSSGVACIDMVMGGGIESGVITEIFGEGGAGKSNLAMLFTISALSIPKKVIFIDSEGFSTERFLQLNSGRTDNMENLLLYRVSSLDDQEVAIIKASKLMDKPGGVGAVVIDSFTEFFRLENFQDYQSRSSAFQRQLNLLTGIATRNSVPVLLTNQIYQDPESGSLHPFGGFLMDHLMKAIYRVEKIAGGRKISVVKHRSIAEGKSALFHLMEYGISCEVP